MQYAVVQKLKSFKVCLIGNSGNSKPTKFLQVKQVLKTVDFPKTETYFPIKHKILQSSRF